MGVFQTAVTTEVRKRIKIHTQKSLVIVRIKGQEINFFLIQLNILCVYTCSHKCE